MKKVTRWGILVLILSGWVAFGILYVVSAREKSQTDTKITELSSELDSYQFMVKDITASEEKINNIISTMEALKADLDRLKDKMQTKQENQNESNQNGQ
jgi:cobalamin biosynthesis Mg chelatase CobN